MTVKAIPDGYRSVTPYLAIEGASELLEFVKRAFGAEEMFRMDAPGGKIGHAEVKIGDSIVMLADASTADQGQPMPGMIHLYVDDVDDVYRRAIEAGATSLRESRRPVLRRPEQRRQGPGWKPMVDCHPRRRCPSRRNVQARRASSAKSLRSHSGRARHGQVA